MKFITPSASAMALAIKSIISAAASGFSRGDGFELACGWPGRRDCATIIVIHRPNRLLYRTATDRAVGRHLGGHDLTDTSGGEEDAQC
jgi:hypothetical protein